MKYVQFTYVDYQTGIPVTEEPARNGPSIPDGVIPTFDIEESRSSGVPRVYGFIEEIQDEGEKSPFLPWMKEISEEDFFQIFKTELKDRARKKRKEVEHRGIVFENLFISTEKSDQERIASLASSLTGEKATYSVDFEYSPGEWVELSKKQIQDLNKAIRDHVQAGRTWCKNLHKEIEDLELDIDSLDKVMPVLEEINSFGAQEEFYPEGDE